jgi:predicted site-specific integrase-resolvase
MSALYALPEAAKALGGISVWTLRKHISNGQIRVIRIGRRVFLDSDELERIRREGLPSLRNGVSAVREEEPCPVK